MVKQKNDKEFNKEFYKNELIPGFRENYPADLLKKLEQEAGIIHKSRG